MKNYNILDCTLRDGGYINNFRFGEKIIKDIICKLADAHTDIIECGFLESNAFNKDETLFGSIEFIEDFIAPKSPFSMYVAMIAYGDIGIDEICDFDGKSVDGIRLTFHQSEIEEAFVFGKQLMKKGYQVFMQPVGTTSYTKEELLNLIEMVNQMKPFAFYMVDTLGTMLNKDLTEMFETVNENLDASIKIGFHSHNNLQMSFSNAIELIKVHSDREIIIDSSVFGMGRGAGNLCTELIMDYLNKVIENKYDIVPVLEIYDEHINKILLNYKWGYSLPYFIASTNNCHPNYATHLINKRTISIKQISNLLSAMDESKKNIYDKNYIEDIYLTFQKHMIDDSDVRSKYEEILRDRNIVILAPGSSINRKLGEIKEFCRENDSIVFSVNFVPEGIDVDYLFVSNRRRIKKLDEVQKLKNVKNYVFTSNLVEHGQFETVDMINYSDYLNEDSVISDNAGLMLINFLNKIGVKAVHLAGFDGFSRNSLDNYFDSAYTNSAEYETLIYKTKAISRRLKALSNSMEIRFLTESKYEEHE